MSLPDVDMEELPCGRLAEIRARSSMAITNEVSFNMTDIERKAGHENK